MPGGAAFHCPVCVVYPTAGDAGDIELMLQNLHSTTAHTMAELTVE